MLLFSSAKKPVKLLFHLVDESLEIHIISFTAISSSVSQAL